MQLRPLALFLLAHLAATVAGSYVLTDSFAGQNFFSQFDFHSDADPTHGFVNYVDRETAQQLGLAGVGDDGAPFIRADASNVVSDSGRQSVRITSKKAYNEGLVIADIAAMPASVCGTWPAFWMFGPNWPNSGEIDIIEGVNDATSSAVTLHTADGCAIDSSASFTGQVHQRNCYVYAAGQATNAGCSIGVADTRSYGDGFNAVGGGVYAVEFNGRRIAVWFFPRDAIPADIASGSPDVSTWGTPMALFSSSTCNISELFKNLNIVFNITFCGDWAGNVWASSPSCAAKAATCQDFVRNNPSAFAGAQWKVNYLHVYRDL